jgi:hypothetical protein
MTTHGKALDGKLLLRLNLSVRFLVLVVVESPRASRFDAARHFHFQTLS